MTEKLKQETIDNLSNLRNSKNIIIRRNNINSFIQED